MGGCTRKIVCGFFLSLLMPYGSSAQFTGVPPPENVEWTQQPRALYVEAINLPSRTPGHSRVDVLYRIDLSFFVAVREQENSASTGFIRHGEILLELTDSTGGTVAREMDKIDESTSEPDVKPGVSWHQGIRSFDLTPATYQIIVTIEDLESNRVFRGQGGTVMAVDFDVRKSDLNTPFFVYPPDSTLQTLVPQNFGGGVKLGTRGALVLPIAGQGIPSRMEIRLSVDHVQPLPNRPSQFYADSIDDFTMLSDVTLVPGKADNEIVYTIDTTGGGQSIAIIPFPTERIPMHRFTLSLRMRTEDSVLTTKKEMGGIWPDKPVSLREIGYAIQSMQNIMTAAELDSLRKGSEKEVIARFEEFWASKDRTPGSAYNEVMNEYYTRVDHAREAFGTLTRPEGSQTDRGRIYILFGPPTRSERKLDPSGFLEIWSYETAAKQFIFLDETKNGNYVLTSTRPL